MGQHGLLKLWKDILNGCKFQLCYLGSSVCSLMKTDFLSIWFDFKSNFYSRLQWYQLASLFTLFLLWSTYGVRDCKYRGILELCVLCLAGLNVTADCLGGCCLTEEVTVQLCCFFLLFGVEGEIGVWASRVHPAIDLQACLCFVSAYLWNYVGTIQEKQKLPEWRLMDR